MSLSKLALSLILLRGTAAVADDPAVLKITKDTSTVSILADERPILHYQRTLNPNKVYVRELFTPSGLNILRDSPSDHVHHHSLMYAMTVDGVDFWSQSASCGRQQPTALGGVKIQPGQQVSQAQFTQELEWIAPDGDKKLIERRTIGALQLADTTVSLVTWRSRFQTPEGKPKVTFSGANYVGLGMRFVESMDRVGKHFKPERIADLTPQKWTAYKAPVDGKTVTVAMFDHPDNARSAHFFRMSTPFTYVAANLNLRKEPLVLEVGTPLNLCYGVAVWDGEVATEQVDKLYQRWVKITHTSSKSDSSSE